MYLVLGLASFAIYWRVVRFDFVNYDDDVYVTNNRDVQDGLSWDGFKWAFTTGHAANWHPLTWLSHMLDCQLFGLEAGRHHFTNLLLHIVNTLLLFSVFRRMTGALWRSWFVAALFAVHPLHIESVAWVAERKDVLSTLFWILTMAGYLGYVRCPCVKRYLLTLFAFLLGLMSKPMLVTLPFVLLLLDYWPLGRFDGAGVKKRVLLYRLVREKIPFFVLSAVSSVVTLFVQRSGGAMKGLEAVALSIRICNAAISYFKYILKMFFPVRLAVLYPYSEYGELLWQGILSALLLLVITVLVIRVGLRRRYLVAGWLWYLGSLVPVIGLVQVGIQSMADRYSYVPLTGLFVIVVWGVWDILLRIYLPFVWRIRYRQIVAGVLGGMVVMVLMVFSWIQVGYWRDSVSLFGHALSVTSDNSTMHSNLGNALSSQGKIDEAIEHYRRALQLKPDFAEAHNNLGAAFQSLGKSDEAVICFQKALANRPDYAEAHNNLAVVLQSQGRLDDAVSHFRRALKAKPDFAAAHNSLGNALASQGKIDEAVSHYHRAIEIAPNDGGAYYNLGIVFQSQGRLDEAVSYYRQALQVAPDYAKAHNNLAIVLLVQGKSDEAISHYRSAIQFAPDNADIHYNLGVALASQGRLDEAIRCYRKALELAPDSLDAYYNLGTALASQGRLDEAVETVQKAIEQALAVQNNELANQLRRQLELYRQAKP